MALPSEVTTLMEALGNLQSATTPTSLASFSRAVSRAADDLELVCEETVDPSVSGQLNSYIERAREAVKTARKNARDAALKADRAALIQPPKAERSDTQSTAGRLAAEINDALRATAAVVAEEIQRSKVAGDVVDESTRRLRMTKDQHGVYADGIVSGASTLKSIRRTDLVANFVLVLCFALFFVAAAYVAKRRLANSNVATFIVTPTYKIASLPFRISTWVLKNSFSKLGSPRLPSQSPSATYAPDDTHVPYTLEQDQHATASEAIVDGFEDHYQGSEGVQEMKLLEDQLETPCASPSQDVKEGIESEQAFLDGTESHYLRGKGLRNTKLLEQPELLSEEDVFDDKERENHAGTTVSGDESDEEEDNTRQMYRICTQEPFQLGTCGT